MSKYFGWIIVGLVFIVCRILGPPWSYLGFAIVSIAVIRSTWSHRSWLIEKWATLFQRTEYDIEREIALADVAMDSAVGDQQNAKRLADWAMAVQHLEADLATTLPKHQRLAKQRTLAVIRRNIADVTRAEGKRHAAATGQPFTLGSFSLPGTLPLVIGGLAFGVPAAWGTVQTFRLHSAKAEIARISDTAEHNAAVARILNDRLSAANLQLQAAADQAAATAVSITHERQIAARMAAAERERQREIQATLTGGPAPAWRLRDGLGNPSPDSPHGAAPAPGAPIGDRT